MYEAILGQPAAMARVLEQERSATARLAGLLAQAERIHIVGIGTSWHAALVGEHLLRTLAGRDDSRAWNSFEFCAYPPRLGPGDAVVVMSHRGTKRYSARALELARASGSSTAVVTGLDSSARADLADVVVRTSPQEKSSAFTISHTSAMTALAMVAVELGLTVGIPLARECRQTLGRLPELAGQALGLEPQTREWAKRAVPSRWLCFAGWGANVATAYEVALKLKEACYVLTEGFQTEQFLHGPFVATSPGTLATFIVPSDRGRQRAMDIVQAVNAAGGETAALLYEGEPDMAGLVRTAITLPAMPEPLTPIIYLVPLQLFTYWLAIELGRDPDVFRFDDPRHAAARQRYQL